MADNVRPIRKPHRAWLNHCPDCDAEIKARWDLAMQSDLESYYADDQVAVDEHEPRMDTTWDRDNEIEDSRGLW